MKIHKLVVTFCKSTSLKKNNENADTNLRYNECDNLYTLLV